MKQKFVALLAVTLTACTLVSLPSSASAQRRGAFRSDYLKTDARFKRVFRPIVDKLRDSTVQIFEKDRTTMVALGTIIDAEGLIITKASKIDDHPIVRLGSGQEHTAKVMARHPKHDLALIQIDEKKLVPVQWRPSKEASVGSWVVSVGTSQDPIALGIISVATRKVRPPRFPMFRNQAFLGVGLSPAEKGAIIDRIVQRSAASRAGLKVRDIILEIAGKEIKSPEQVSKTLLPYKPGDRVKVKIRRGEKELEVEARLGDRPKSRGEMQNRMGSKLSNRRDGFPVILQHDSVVKPEECGGPLVDLDGKVIGINISRAGRTESYAIPTEVVLTLIEELRSTKNRVSKK